MLTELNECVVFTVYLLFFSKTNFGDDFVLLSPVKT